MSTEPTPRQILLALDSVQDLMALEAATELAALLRATLQGVFVENAELLRVAQLPFAYEVSLTSATPRRLEIHQLERDLRAQAEQVRQMMARQAALHRVNWTFRVERGVVGAALSGSEALDVVVLGRSYRHSAPEQQRSGAILIAFDGSSDSLRALETAVPLAGAANDLLVLLPAAQVATLRPQAAAKLATLGARGHYLTLPDLSPPRLLEIGRRYQCRMLVLGATPSLTPQQLQQLLQQSSCPLALIR